MDDAASTGSQGGRGARPRVQLTESERARIDTCERELHELKEGGFDDPKREDVDKIATELDERIKAISAQIDEMKAHQQEVRPRSKAPEDAPPPSKSGAQQERQDAAKTCREIAEALGKLRARRKAALEDLRDGQDKTGKKKSEDAVRRLDEIEDRIDAGSLPRHQHTRLMGEKARIEQGLPKLKAAEDLLAQIAPELDRLGKEFEVARGVRDSVDEKIKALDAQASALQAEVAAAAEVAKHEKEAIGFEIRKKVDEINALREDRKKLWADFAQLRSERYKKRQRRKELQNLISAIYREAREMRAREEEWRPRPVVQVNPFLEQLRAARSLIAYLDGLLEEEEAVTAAASVVGKVTPQLSAEFQGVRRAPKAKRTRQVKTEKARLALEPAAYEQFLLTDVKPPLVLAEIPETLKQLSEKVAVWEDNFRVSLGIMVGDDGSISRVSILLQ